MKYVVRFGEAVNMDIFANSMVELDESIESWLGTFQANPTISKHLCGPIEIYSHDGEYVGRYLR